MKDVKLIIWDLDGTLWQGTLAENETIVLNKNIVEKIEFLLNRGILSSIASKNDFDKALSKLKEFNIDNLFIFPKISFQDKGPQIKQTIEEAQLRAENVLFIDDNEFVLREVKFHIPNIMTLNINDFLKLDISTWGKDDNKRERLKQYRILEKKHHVKTDFLKQNKNEFDFLRECEIEINLTPMKFKDKDVDRIVELVNRSNQMNFTHSRIKLDYVFCLDELALRSNFKISVKDKYGNYGIVGYVCINQNMLKHFVFSCRILGMRVDAKTFRFLKKNFPDLKANFPLNKIQDIDANLDFIKINFNEEPVANKSLSEKKILVRGTCFCNAISSLLNEKFAIDDEIFILLEYANLILLKSQTENKEKILLKSNQSMNKEINYYAVINFLESEYYSGIYQIGKESVPLSSYYMYWENILKSSILDYVYSTGVDVIKTISKNVAGVIADRSCLERALLAMISKFPDSASTFVCKKLINYMYKNYKGYISSEEFEGLITWYVNSYSKDTKLIFINPPEKIKLPFLNEEQNNKVMQRTITLNNIMRTISKKFDNVFILEMDELLDSKDIVDVFSHLTRQGYVKISFALNKLLSAG